MVSQTMAVYAATTTGAFISGWFLSCYGPLIPFYSQATELDETHYSFIMMFRSFGIITGLIASKFLPKIISSKTLLLQTALALAIVNFTSTLSLSDFNLAFSYAFMAAHSILSNAIGFGVTFQLFPNDSTWYLQIRGFVFGAGALAGPSIVAWLELNNFALMAVCNMITALTYMTYPIPQLQSKKQGQATGKPFMGIKSQLFICALMFLFCGMQGGLASWMPTYAIKAGVSSVQGSSFYSWLFWCTNCFSRLGWMHVPGSVMDRLKLIFKSMIVSTSLSMLFQWQDFLNLVCWFAPLTSGALLASIFPFLVGLPADAGFQPTTDNTAHFMLANAIGEGLLNMPIGYGISVFSFRVLMVVQVFLSVLSCVVLFRVDDSLKQELRNCQKQCLLQGLEMKQTFS